MRHLVVTDSDIIESIGFDAADDEEKQQMVGTLEMTFKSSPNTIYKYERVRFEEFIKLISAESIGEAFHKQFHKTQYPFTKSAKPPTIKK